MDLILPFKGISPRIDPTAFVAPNATIVGDVEIGEGSSIWFGAVLRADLNRIRIGKGTNIQDNTVVHVGDPPADTIISKYRTLPKAIITLSLIIRDQLTMPTAVTWSFSISAW